MAWVADYTHRIAPAMLRTAGAVGVCRYLSYPVPSGKVITKAEYDELRQAGIVVILNWEYAATDWLGGAAAGAAHAAEAARQAQALGYPPGSVIPGSADINMTADEWSSRGRAYGAAFRDELRQRGYRPGVYGPWDVLGWCKGIGFDWFWQAGMSTAWSGYRNADPWPGAHLRQRFKTTVGGQEVDHNDILRDDWSADVNTAQETSPGHIERVVADTANRQVANQTEVDNRLTAIETALGNIETKVDGITMPTLDAAAVAANLDYDKLAAAITARVHLA